MKKEKIIIEGIPALIWGEKSSKAYIHVHGKMSCKEYAEQFALLAEEKGFQTISFDLPLHGERKNENYDCNIQNGICDLSKIGEYVFANWKDVSLFACSLGAFFSLNAYKDKKFSKCLFQSPIVDMNYLINQMFIWFNVTKEELEIQKEIPTPIETLSWDYYQFVLNNPTESWVSPTNILYGGKDNLQSIEVIKAFCKKFDCKLFVAENSTHPFMEEKEIMIANKWLQENI